AELRRYDASAPAPGAAAPKDLRDSVGAAAGAPQASKTLKKADQAVLDALGAANGDFQFERYRGAIDLYLKALALDRKSGILSPTQIAVVYERVGASYNKLGLSRQAIAVLRRCVQEAPMDAAAHYQLALAYAVSGRYQESIHALNETLESAPSKAELRRYMLLARTDSELDAVRELPAFQAALSGHLKRSLAAR
ncbi:MAG: tetratricopeptide repeat protein, partial [Elusimicrobia bacterium]|nr:tetratricopeptide repeat protein [Elusimicrobiota bacterium]